VEPPHVETPQESLDRLRLEVEALRASRERLVVGDDADRRSFERDLHDGPQQHLIALAVKLQLARQLADSDPSAVGPLLDELERDVQEALDDTGRLAHRIYPPLLAAGGLGAALRMAAVDIGIPVRLDVTADLRDAPEVAGAVYFCCLDVLERAGAEAELTVTVRDEDWALAFEIAGSDAVSSASRDRVEALGGQLTVQEDSGGGRVSGSLPLSR
jgi:signal transduction histidine kinase